MKAPRVGSTMPVNGQGKAPTAFLGRNIRGEGLNKDHMQDRRPKLDRQGLLRPADTKRYRAQIASSLSAVGAMGRFMERVDQKSQLKYIDADVLPDEYLDKCVISYPPDCEIVVDGDAVGSYEKLDGIARLMGSKGIDVVVTKSSVIPPDMRYMYSQIDPDRAPERAQLRAIMESKWDHHVWTEYLVAEIGNAAVRSAKFNEKGERIAKAQPIRLIGFAPCTFLIPAWGAAEGLRHDGMMKDASIKRATDALYRRPGNLAVFVEYAEKVAEMDKRWREAERQPVKPAGKLYVIKKNPTVYRSRVEAQPQELPAQKAKVVQLSPVRQQRLVVDIDDKTMDLLKMKPRVGDRSHHAFKIVKRLKARGWVENAIAELIPLYDGLCAYRHKGGTEDGNAEAGRNRLRLAYAKIVTRESEQKRVKDSIFEKSKSLPLAPSARAVLDVLLDVEGVVAHPGDHELQRRTGLSPHAVTKAKYKLMKFGLIQETGPKRGPGDTEAQSYLLKEQMGGCELEVHTFSKSFSCKASRWETHLAVRELRGRGIASAFTWQGERVIELVMGGCTVEEVLKKLGIEGVREAWRQRSATHRRIKKQREAYKAWLRRSMVDDCESFMEWDKQMAVKLAEMWKRAA
ncbi:hypothetical protein K2Z84_32015 [Candidatus Binatia bacterium]|nr:hypothetical protein [Candidatus Binatia bacterium]